MLPVPASLALAICRGPKTLPHDPGSLRSTGRARGPVPISGVASPVWAWGMSCWDAMASRSNRASDGSPVGEHQDQRKRPSGRPKPPRWFLRSGDPLAPGGVRTIPAFGDYRGSALCPVSARAGGVRDSPAIGDYRGSAFLARGSLAPDGVHLPSAALDRRNDQGLSIRCVSSPLRSPIEVRRPVGVAGPVPASLIRASHPVTSTRSPKRPFVWSGSRFGQARSG